tara:strand:- start:9 stop:680 length:672 start_codon:yes stop_codon:yes gene_type:complete
MKKLLITFFTVILFSSSALAWERSGGISISLAGIDTTVTDDVDSNGTTDTTKDISNTVGIPSLFIEATNVGDRGTMTVGIDVIPMSAEFDSRSTTQSSLKDKSSSSTSGTNKGTVDVDKHITFYIQPGVQIDSDTTAFVTLGYVTADVETDVQSVSSTNKVVSDTLDGTKLGVGVKRSTDFGFMKVEFAKTDYDPISVTTSNNTKVTGDIDNTALTLSFGKAF